MATNASSSSSEQRQRNKINEGETTTITTANNDDDETTKPSSSSQSKTSQSKTTTSGVVYDVEHLATFSTDGSHETNNRLANTNGTKTKLESADSGCGDGGIKRQHQHLLPTSSSTTTPKLALQKLFELEKLSGIWTQHMQIELRDDFMLIVDCETDSVVERFSRESVTKPEAFNQYNDIYNNIVVFVITQSQNLDTNRQASNNEHNEGENSKLMNDECERGESLRENYNTKEKEGELHIFKCVSHEAQQLVADILNWKSGQPSTAQSVVDGCQLEAAMASDQDSADQMESSSSHRQKSSSIHQRANVNVKPATNGKPMLTVASSARASETVPIVNVNVKETVQVFNQIAALREKSSKPTSPTSNQVRPLSDGSAASSHSTSAAAAAVESSKPLNGLSESNGGTADANRGPLSPGDGGGLYKQRSIRATLAPKQPQPNGESSSPPKLTELVKQASGGSSNSSANAKHSGSASSSSLASSGEPRSPPTTYQHQSTPPSAGGGRHSSGDYSGVKQPNGAQQTNAHHQHRNGSKSRSAQQQRPKSESSHSHASSSSQSQQDQVTTNESYVSVLNHCFDDIEKFIIRLQQAVTAIRELQAKRKSSSSSKRSQSNQESKSNNEYLKGASGSGQQVTAAELAMLNARACGPTEDDYFEILSKFKLAFNLLAKLKGCIHEPNAPELVHFLFTPLAIIIESARNANPPIDPTLVGIPYLNQDALDLLSNCCTSKESDIWISLGPNWTQTIDMNLLKASRLPSSFQPIFSDGWAPIICELELIGLVAPPSDYNTTSTADINQHHHHHPQVSSSRRKHPAMQLTTNDDEQPVGYHQVTTQVERSSAYSTGMIGQANGSSQKSHMKRRSAPVGPPPPPLNRYLADEDTTQPQPYLNTVPYGFMHEPSVVDVTKNLRDMPAGIINHKQPSSDHSRHRFSATSAVSQAFSRRLNKHSSRHLPDHPSSSSSGYNPMISFHHHRHHQQQPLDDERHVDLIAQQNGGVMHHAVDPVGTTMPDSYLDGYLDSDGPGPSSHHYRGEKNHSRHSRHHKNSHNPYNQQYSNNILPPFDTNYINEYDQEAMLLDLGPAQTEWFYELQSRGALIVRVLFTRDANNDKELSVRRGEILEVLDDTRKWWRARNIDLQVAYVPHTIVAIMQGYQTLDELLANNPGDGSSEEPSMMNAHRRRELQPANFGQLNQWNEHEDKRNSKTAGAFRYF